MSLFLTEEELVILTGRKKKNLRLEQLRKMGVPFFVNAVGAQEGAVMVCHGAGR